MPGWLRSAGSGPLMWMLSNAPSTAWISQHQRKENKNKTTGVYLDDPGKGLRFYTEVLGFAKKADFSQGPFRWLTVASPEEPDATELQLALNDNPAAKAYQQAMF